MHQRRRISNHMANVCSKARQLCKKSKMPFWLQMAQNPSCWRPDRVRFYTSIKPRKNLFRDSKWFVQKVQNVQKAGSKITRKGLLANLVHSKSKRCILYLKKIHMRFWHDLDLLEQQAQNGAWIWAKLQKSSCSKKNLPWCVKTSFDHENTNFEV